MANRNVGRAPAPSFALQHHALHREHPLHQLRLLGCGPVQGKARARPQTIDGGQRVGRVEGVLSHPLQQPVPRGMELERRAVVADDLTALGQELYTFAAEHVSLGQGLGGGQAQPGQLPSQGRIAPDLLQARPVNLRGVNGNVNGKDSAGAAFRLSCVPIPGAAVACEAWVQDVPFHKKRRSDFVSGVDVECP